MKLTRPIPRRARVEMIPLIDAMFILLVFFIYAMISMMVHRGIRVDLPQADAASTRDEKALVISVRASGQIYADHEATSIEALGARLSDYRNTTDQPAVLVNADASVAHGVVAQVLSRVQAAAIERVTILTREGEGEP